VHREETLSSAHEEKWCGHHDHIERLRPIGCKRISQVQTVQEKGEHAVATTVEISRGVPFSAVFGKGEKRALKAPGSRLNEKKRGRPIPQGKFERGEKGSILWVSRAKRTPDSCSAKNDP